MPERDKLLDCVADVPFAGPQVGAKRWNGGPCEATFLSVHVFLREQDPHAKRGRRQARVLHKLHYPGVRRRSKFLTGVSGGTFFSAIAARLLFGNPQLHHGDAAKVRPATAVLE